MVSARKSGCARDPADGRRGSHLFTEVERRLSFYLRALWGRSMELREEGMAPGTGEGSGKKGRRVAIGEGFIRMPQAFDVFPGQEGLMLYRAAAAHAAAHLTY